MKLLKEFAGRLTSRTLPLRPGAGFGRILRLRPGPLANFSGGAGYMPMMVCYSVPASVLFYLLSSVFLAAAGRKYQRRRDARFPTTEPHTPLATFADYARIHLLVCAAITLIGGGALYAKGLDMIYGETSQYLFVTFAFCAWPIVAAFLSTAFLVWSIKHSGGVWIHVMSSVAAFALLMAAAIPAIYFV